MFEFIFSYIASWYNYWFPEEPRCEMVRSQKKIRKFPITPYKRKRPPSLPPLHPKKRPRRMGCTSPNALPEVLIHNLTILRPPLISNYISQNFDSLGTD